MCIRDSCIPAWRFEYRGRALLSLDSQSCGTPSVGSILCPSLHIDIAPATSIFHDLLNNNKQGLRLYSFTFNIPSSIVLNKRSCLITYPYILYPPTKYNVMLLFKHYFVLILWLQLILIILLRHHWSNDINLPFLLPRFLTPIQVSLQTNAFTNLFLVIQLCY